MGFITLAFANVAEAFKPAHVDKNDAQGGRIEAPASRRRVDTRGHWAPPVAGLPAAKGNLLSGLVVTESGRAVCGGVIDFGLLRGGAAGHPAVRLVGRGCGGAACHLFASNRWHGNVMAAADARRPGAPALEEALSWRAARLQPHASVRASAWVSRSWPTRRFCWLVRFFD